VDNTAGGCERFAQLLDNSSYQLAWRYACRLAQTRENAEDLLQDTLAHAMLHIGQLKQDAAFRSWLLSILRTQFLMSQRGQARRTQAEAQLCELQETAPWQIHGSDNAQAEALVAGLEQLPREYSSLLCLHYLEGFDAKELARVLGLRRGAVEQRLHRARLALKRAMAGQDAVQQMLGHEEN
jgi:RNA polymerase sigma-70 factor, ECF subfamily